MEPQVSSKREQFIDQFEKNEVLAKKKNIGGKNKPLMCNGTTVQEKKSANHLVAGTQNTKNVLDLEAQAW